MILTSARRWWPPLPWCRQPRGERYGGGEAQACDCVRMVHFRRKAFELAEVARAPLAAEAVRRIDEVFDADVDRRGIGTPLAG
jgi:hypothetical protein